MLLLLVVLMVGGTLAYIFREQVHQHHHRRQNHSTNTATTDKININTIIIIYRWSGPWRQKWWQTYATIFQGILQIRFDFSHTSFPTVILSIAFTIIIFTIMPSLWKSGHPVLGRSAISTSMLWLFDRTSWSSLADVEVNVIINCFLIIIVMAAYDQDGKSFSFIPQVASNEEVY